jgi:hypothetical protein
MICLEDVDRDGSNATSFRYWPLLPHSTTAESPNVDLPRIVVLT